MVNANCRENKAFKRSRRQSDTSTPKTTSQLRFWSSTPWYLRAATCGLFVSRKPASTASIGATPQLGGTFDVFRLNYPPASISKFFFDRRRLNRCMMSSFSTTTAPAPKRRKIGSHERSLAMQQAPCHFGDIVDTQTASRFVLISYFYVSALLGYLNTPLTDPDSCPLLPICKLSLCGSSYQ